MAKAKKGPLGPEHLEALNRLLDACGETAKMCGACEECHLDVTPEREKNAEQMEIARRLKAKFFPTAK